MENSPSSHGDTPTSPIVGSATNYFLKPSNLRRLARYLEPHRGYMVTAIFSSVVGTCFGLTLPVLIVKLLESIGRTRDLNFLNMIAVASLAVFLLHAIFSFVESYLLSYIGERVVYDIRIELYRHLHGLFLDFFGKWRAGDLITRISSDVTQMRNVLTNGIALLLSHSLAVIGALAVMVYMNGRLALFILGATPLLVLLTVFFSKRIKKPAREYKINWLSPRWWRKKDCKARKW